MRRRRDADPFQQCCVGSDRLALQSRVERQGLSTGHRWMERHVLRQITELPPGARGGTGAGILTKHQHAADTRPHQAEHHLDQRALACAVVANQSDTFAGAERQIEFAHRLQAAIAMGDAAA